MRHWQQFSRLVVTVVGSESDDETHPDFLPLLGLKGPSVNFVTADGDEHFPFSNPCDSSWDSQTRPRTMAGSDWTRSLSALDKWEVHFA